MDQLISFDTAKLAKQRGFDLPCHNTYDTYHGEKLTSSVTFNESPHNWNLYPDGHSAPTQTKLQKWLRETHRIHVYVLPSAKNGDLVWDSQTSSTKNYNATYRSFLPSWAGVGCESFEDALEKGLQQALKAIKYEGVTG